MRDDTDWTLIQACRRGDAHAWEAVLDKYERLVYSIALNYGLHADDAADIAQLTFTILLQSLDVFDENVHLGGWLATVSRRHIWRLIDRHRREGSYLSHDDNQAVVSQLPDNTGTLPFQQWETIEWLNMGLTALDEKCRQLLLLLYFGKEQPSYQDIAAQLNLPVGSIGPTRARCLVRLRKLLQNSD